MSRFQRGRFQQQNRGWQASAVAAPGVAVGSREKFISRTYNHLFASIALFTLIEIALFKTGLAPVIANAMMGTSWLLVLGGFVVVSWFASHVAHRSSSLPKQYAALIGFVAAEALLFVPMLYIAESYAPGVTASAATVTFIGFIGLTGVAFWTRKDFSFLGGVVRWGLILALVAIVGGLIFGFELGMFFSVGMVGLAGAAILYDTSNILHHFPEDRYVGAALQLFASVALMFWYVLRIFMGGRD